MSNRLITLEQYQAFVEAFRKSPGNFTFAARAGRCDRRMAKRAWELGWADRFPWAKPIRDLLQEEHYAARAQALEDQERGRRHAAELAEKSRQEAVDVLAQEAAILNAARADLRAELALAGSLAPSLRILVDRIKAAIERGEVGTKQAVSILSRFSIIVNRAAAAADSLIAAERRRKGEPTEVIGLQVEDMTPSEALRELENVREMLELAKDREAGVDTHTLAYKRARNAASDPDVQN